MGAVRVKTVNDRLLNIDYSDPEMIKQLISNWSMIEAQANKGDTVASAILVDLQDAVGCDILEFQNEKKTGFNPEIVSRGAMTEAQFISVMYVVGLGYTQDEVAYILGCKKQTVNIHIARGLHRICRYLEGGRKSIETAKEKRGRSSGQVAKRTRSVLYRQKQRKKGKRKTPLPHSRSGAQEAKKRNPHKLSE